MIFRCTRCHFLFSRAGKVDSCPDCGGHNFVVATAEDKVEYERLRKEFSNEEDSKNEE